MAFQNPGEQEICSYLKTKVKTIAVVGLSPKPDRPSYHVAEEMQHFGYRIIPVRPALDSVLGEKAYATLADVPEKIDLVDVFRASEHVQEIIDECLRLKLPAVWLQDGVINEAAAQQARDAGLWVVMDRCVYRDYKNICQSGSK